MPVGPVNGGGLEAIKREAFTDKENIRNLSEQIELDQNKSEEMEKKGYTVIRVKRKVTDDPEKGLQLTAKKRKIDFTLEYAGTLPFDSDNAKAIEIARTPSRKRKSSNQLLAVVDAIKSKFSPKLSRKEAKIEEEENRVYDIYLEEIRNRKECDITLNGAKLIRETLNIADKEQELEEYVYDIYYAPRNFEINRDELDFEAIHNVYKNEDADDVRPDWQEDEDSNDEDNWRNDYPDESASDSYNSSEDYQNDGYGGREERGDYASDRSGEDPMDAFCTFSD